MAIQSSVELQEIALSSVLKDSYLLSKLKVYITESFFSTLSYRLIYRSLVYFYNKYSKLPDMKEIIVTMAELHNPQYGDLPTAKDHLLKLWNSPQHDEQFVINQLTMFIKRNKVENTLKGLTDVLNSDKAVGIETVAQQLIDSMSVELSKSSVFTLGDTSSLIEVRTEAVGNEDSPMVIRSSIDPINSCLQFKGYKPGDVIMVVAEPGVGKTTLMINEGTAAAKQGFNVCHIFIGDMVRYDGFVRYTSLITDIPQDDIVIMKPNQQSELIKKHNFTGIFNRIHVLSYAASEITIDQMMEEVYRTQNSLKIHFDMILVDYPDNLISESDMMYESGGAIYNKLSLLSRVNHSVVISGCQPKQCYWGQEIIPKDGAAESSKKQHVIDLMINMGLPGVGAPIGSLFLAKVRRGSEGRIIRIKRDMSRARIEPATEQEYLQAKANL